MTAIPNQRQQKPFADGEVVTTKVIGGSAEFWIMAIAVILLVMNCQKARLRLPYTAIMRRLTIKYRKTATERNLQTNDEWRMTNDE